MSATPAAVPVLDIGGTHVTAASVAGDAVLEQYRVPLDAHSDPVRIVEQIVEAARRLRGPRDTARWAVAIPGPFDYTGGIGDFAGVDKFQSLKGFDLGRALRCALPETPAVVSFVNDAEAAALGEWSARGRPHRLVSLTLGTGVGSGFILDGHPVTSGPNVPSDGNIHTETWHELPLEQTVSRDAIRRAFETRTGSNADVDDIARLARGGHRAAAAALTEAMIALGAVLARWVDRFDPEVVVIGGSMSRSWDVLKPGLLYGLGLAEREPIVTPTRTADDAPLIGASTHLTLVASPRGPATARSI